MNPTPMPESMLHRRAAAWLARGWLAAALLLMLLLIVFDAVASSWQAWRAGAAGGQR
ncbi:MAG: hypothetical protein AB7S55_09500 [Thiomonas sp.]